MLVNGVGRKGCKMGMSAVLNSDVGMRDSLRDPKLWGTTNSRPDCQANTNLMSAHTSFEPVAGVCPCKRLVDFGC